jgi:hypothetical protein
MTQKHCAIRPHIPAGLGFRKGQVAETLAAEHDSGSDADVLQDITRFNVDITATLVFAKYLNTLESDDDAFQRQWVSFFRWSTIEWAPRFPIGAISSFPEIIGSTAP